MEQMVKKDGANNATSMQHAVASQKCHMSTMIDAKLKRIANEVKGLMKRLRRLKQDWRTQK